MMIISKAFRAPVRGLWRGERAGVFVSTTVVDVQRLGRRLAVLLRLAQLERPRVERDLLVEFL